MPAVPPYATVKASINGGALTSGGITVASGDTVQLSGESTAQWTSQRWELYAFPEGMSAPAGWSTDANGKFYSTAVTPPVFSIPSTTYWGKIAVRLTVNDGLFAGVVNAQMKDESTAFSQRSPGLGLRDIFEGETNQFATSHAIELQRTLRQLEYYQDDYHRIRPIIGKVRTTDATVTTVASFTMSDETMVAFDAIVVAGRRVNVTEGGRWKRSVVYRRTGAGVATIVGTLETGTDQETSAGLDVTIDTDGANTVRVRVTGLAATDINWGCELRYQEITNA